MSALCPAGKESLSDTVTETETVLYPGGDYTYVGIWKE